MRTLRISKYLIVTLSCFAVLGANAEAQSEMSGDPSGAHLSDDTQNIRDPFLPPEIAKPEEKLTELERYPLSELKVMGILAGLKENTAMVVAPDGKTFFVKKNTPIGNRRGVVTDVSDDTILIREKFINVFGREEAVNARLSLSPESHDLPSASNFPAPSGY